VDGVAWRRHAVLCAANVNDIDAGKRSAAPALNVCRAVGHIATHTLRGIAGVRALLRCARIINAGWVPDAVAFCRYISAFCFATRICACASGVPAI